MEQPIEPQLEPTAPLQPVLPGVTTLIRVSLRLYRDIFSKISPFLTISYLASSLILFLNYHGNIVLAIGGAVLNSVISAIIYIALIRIVSGEEHDAGDIVGNIIKSSKLLWAYIWISILNIAIVFGGAIFLVIPGIIVSLYVFLSAYVLVAENKKGFDALFTSWEYVQGRWLQVAMKLLGFGLFFLISLLAFTIILVVCGVPLQDSSAAVSFGSGLIQQFIQTFFFMPMNLIFLYVLYITLKSTALPPTQLAASRVRKIFKTLCVIGLLLIIGLSILFNLLFIQDLKGGQFRFINTIKEQVNL